MRAGEKKPRFVSLQTHLIAAILVMVALSMLLVSVIWYSSTVRVMERDAISNVSASITSTATQLDDFMRSAISVANQLSYSNTKYLSLIHNGPYNEDGTFNTLSWELEEYMSGFFAFSENIRGIAIISPNKYLFQSGLAISPSYDIYGKPFVQRALAGSDRALFARQYETMYSSMSGRSSDTLSILTPIRMMGKVYGAVMVNIDNNTIVDYVNRFYIPEGARILSMLPDGQVLFDSETYGLPVEMISIKETDLAELNGGDLNESGIYEHVIEGRECLVMLEKSAYSGITMMGVIERSVLRKSVTEILSASLLTLVIVIIPLMLIIVAIIRHMTRRLRTLRNTMVAVSADSIGVQVEVGGRDEITELAGTFNQMMTRIEGLMGDVKLKEEAKRKMEREVFRAQINPHFIYNTLGTIRHLAALRGARNIESITLSLTQLLRASLDDMNELIPMDREIGFAEHYMALQKFRYLDDITFEVVRDPSAEDALVLRMLIQPLIENALIHGFEGVKSRGLIRLSVERREGQVYVSVYDDGKGIPADLIDRLLEGEDRLGPDGSVRIGLRNVHRRIQLNFSDEYGLRIKSREGEYTRVVAVMPYISSREEGVK